MYPKKFCFLKKDTKILTVLASQLDLLFALFCERRFQLILIPKAKDVNGTGFCSELWTYLFYLITQKAQTDVQTRFRMRGCLSWWRKMKTRRNRPWIDDGDRADAWAVISIFEVIAVSHRRLRYVCFDKYSLVNNVFQHCSKYIAVNTLSGQVW